MRKLLLSALLLLFICTKPAAQQIEVTFVSPTECDLAHGAYRWDVKTDQELPPDTIPDTNKVKPSDIAQWPPLQGKVTMHTPRSGREKDWFEVTGKVVLVRAEADGDLHIQLKDADGQSDIMVVVEIPVKQHTGESPWDESRTQVFGWSKTKFPFTLTSDRQLDLIKTPIIRVQGKAFFDAMHKGATPNRRKSDPNVTVWEIHPVMTLQEVESP